MPGCKGGRWGCAAAGRADQAARADQFARECLHCDLERARIHSSTATSVFGAHPAHPLEFGIKPRTATGIGFCSFQRVTQSCTPERLL